MTAHNAKNEAATIATPAASTAQAKPADAKVKTETKQGDGWMTKPFLGSAQTTNGDIIRGTVITVGYTALTAATVFGVAYAFQKMFGDDNALGDTAFGGESYSL